MLDDGDGGEGQRLVSIPGGQFIRACCTLFNGTATLNSRLLLSSDLSSISFRETWTFLLERWFIMLLLPQEASTFPIPTNAFSVLTGRRAAATGRGAATTGRGAATTGQGAATTGRGAATTGRVGQLGEGT